MTGDAEPSLPALVVVCGQCPDRHHPERGRFVERFRHDRDAAQWVPSAQTPELLLSAENQFTDGWTRGADVRSVWSLRCAGCGDRALVRDERLQVVTWWLVQRLATGEGPGRVLPRKLPPVSLGELRRCASSLPEWVATPWRRT